MATAMKLLLLAMWLMCLLRVGECVLPPLLLEKEISENDAIINYFKAGYKYATIISILATYHGMRISLSKLKRILRQHTLKRRQIDVDENELRNAIQNELSGPGSLSGYRDMWNTLRQDYGIQVPRDRVMKCLREMDPIGTRQRYHRRLKRRIYRNKGPNYAWHVDGYDKLRPYGFEIHGCIDGYSRRIMWLEVGPSNKNPEIICGYYLKCVRQIGGCPRIIRTDPGTENTLLAAVQCTFRRNATDDFAGTGAHRYGKSVFNQRIEAWWSYYKKNRSGWWIEKFKDLADFGALDIGNDFHIKCMRFCFMDILQDDIDRCARKWNDHSMRPVRDSVCPHGKPNVLYILPQENDTQDFKSNVPEEDIDWAESLSKLTNSKTGGDDIFFENILQRDGLSLPTNWDEAVKLYLHLTA